MLEIVLIGIIILIQIGFFAYLIKKIFVFRQLYPADTNYIDIDEKSDRGIQVNFKKPNGFQLTLQENINDYLFCNKGLSVNFTIIKDIIERETEIYEEEIASSIQTPLYLGLGATMLGIIFGLGSMFFSPEKTTTALTSQTVNSSQPAMDSVSAANTLVMDVATFHEGDNSESESTGALISLDSLAILFRNVKWAMGASLLGLFLTTVLSVLVFTPAKSRVLKGKNRFLSIVQARLIPEFNREDESEIAGLKRYLNEFSRNSSEVISKMSLLVVQSSESIKKQHEIIRKVESLNINRMAQETAGMFEQFVQNKKAFEDLTSHLQSLSAITSHMSQFAERSKNIEEIANEVRGNIRDSKVLFDFLSTKTQNLKAIAEDSEKSVNQVYFDFGSFVSEFKSKIEGNIEAITSASAKTEGSLKEIFNDLSVNMDKASTAYVKKYEEKLNELLAAPTTTDLPQAIKGLSGQMTHQNAQLERLLTDLHIVTSSIQTVAIKLSELPSGENAYTTKKVVDKGGIEDRVNKKKEEKDEEKKIEKKMEEKKDGLLKKIFSFFRKEKREQMEKESSMVEDYEKQEETVE